MGSVRSNRGKKCPGPLCVAVGVAVEVEEQRDPEARLSLQVGDAEVPALEVAGHADLRAVLEAHLEGDCGRKRVITKKTTP